MSESPSYRIGPKLGVLHHALIVDYTFRCHPEGNEVRSLPLTYAHGRFRHPASGDTYTSMYGVGERRGILTRGAPGSLLRRDDKL